MSFFTDLRSMILADATVSGLIGTRIYTSEVPQSPTVPYIVYFVISDNGYYSQDGATNFNSPRVQFNCIGNTILEAESVADALRDRLDSFKGVIGSTNFQSCQKDNRRELEKDPDTKLSGLSEDYFVFWSTP